MLARKLFAAFLACLLAASAAAVEEPVSEDMIATAPEGEKSDAGSTVESDS